MIELIIIGLLIFIMLLPSTVTTIKVGVFEYEYSARIHYKRCRQFRNYIRFHWWKLNMDKLMGFYRGGYINKWQLKRLWEYYKFDKELTLE